MTRPLRLRLLLVAAGLVAAAGCKGPEDWLADLHQVHGDRGKLKIDVYDAGQLSFEAMSGLAEQDALTVSQMARAVAKCAYIAEGAESPLLRAQAVRLASRLALRWPLEPARDAFLDVAEPPVVAAEQIHRLEAQGRRMEIETAHLPNLRNPDRAVAEAALVQLREITGVDVGRTFEAWDAWWRENRARVRAEAAAESLEPIRTLARLRLTREGRTSGGARAVLEYLGLHVALFEMPELRAEVDYALRRLARQTVVQLTVAALRSEDSSVRAAGAVAAAQVLDPDYGPALLYALPRERDAEARVKILEALSAYPGRGAAEAAIKQLAEDDRAVRLAAHRTLVALTAEDHGMEATAWTLWWERTGIHRWP
ncbi:MAG TPA: hypothetical protein VEI02_14925 [Planctomycetota bacterium]|nr:hypothetical protein [Planctomycetota bacterium]